MNKPTDKIDSPTTSATGNNPAAGEDRQKPATPGAPVEISSEFAVEDSAQMEKRRQALRSMLAATEARQQHVKKSRSKKTLAAGIEVLITSGSYRGIHGLILDADYIHNRVLVSLHVDQSHHWFDFTEVTTDTSNNGEQRPPSGD